MLTKEKLTPVNEDPSVIEAQGTLRTAKTTLEECRLRVEKYSTIMIPYHRATTTKSFSEEDVFEAQMGWDDANKDLSFCELDIRHLQAKFNAATKEAIAVRVPELRQKMRGAVAKFYQELDKTMVVNGEVHEVWREACRILGETQHEVPNQAWPEFLPPEYRAKNTENLLEFRRSRGKKEGWL